MRTNKLLIGALAVLFSGLASCSSEEPAGGNPEEGSNNDKQYMSVIISTPEMSNGGRSLPEDSDFEMGEGAECSILAENMMFLFFDKDGNPFPLAASNVNGETVSNMVIPKEVSEDHGTGEEAGTVKARLVLGKAVGDGYVGQQPAQLLCIVNYQQRVTPESVTNKRLSDVLSKTATLPTLTTEVGFMMTNAAYVDADGNVQRTTKLDGCFKSAPDEADAAPVVVYVERVVAKVRVEFNKANRDINGHFTVKARTATGTVEDGKFTIDDEPNTTVKVQLQAWDLIHTAADNYIFKRIENKEYFTDWNDPARHRSYWTEPLNGITTNRTYDIYAPYTTNTEGQTIENPNYVNNGEWISHTALFADGPTTDASGDTPAAEAERPLGAPVEYCLERTIQPEVPEGATGTPATYRKSTATGIVIRAALQLEKKNNDGTGTGVWEPATIVRWAGAYYRYNTFRQMVADAYNGRISSGSTQATAENVILSRIGDSNYCNTSISFGGNTTPMSNFSNIQVWRRGLTSYYLNIEHTPGSTADKKLYGVVRNHIYHYVIDNVIGLGIPGNDPEIPEETESFLSARVYCLAWRLVTNHVTLE